MMRKRTRRIGRLDSCVRAGVVALSAALLAAGEPVSPIDTSPVPTDERSLDASVVSSVDARVCDSDAECDDGNGCTIDACTLATCTHTTIPDCVSCTPDLICPHIEVVFVLDTSGSMKDEAMALCMAIAQITSDLSGDVDVSMTVLGITETLGKSFPCMTDNVVNLLGGDVPGDASSCSFPDDLSSYEAWGPATAIVAERFPWTAGATHLVIPIGDEGPCNGSRPDGCNDPGDDRDSVMNAISVAAARGVIVSPISGSGADVCVTELCGALAAGTGGTAFQTDDPIVDFPIFIRNAILQTCEEDPSCDDGNSCTRDDTCVDGACTGELADGCVPCTTPNGSCSDGNACTNDTCDQMECVSTLSYNDAVSCCDPSTGELTPITDANSCTTDVCDTDTGEVTHDVLPDGEFCNDGLFCNTGETCTGGECGGGSPFDCSNLDDQCHEGVCDEDEEKCHSQPAHEAEPCDDGLFCTDGETCVVGTCESGSPHDCSNLTDQCNLGVCNEVSDACEQQASNEGAHCDDGLFCSDGEVCREGACTDGTPHDCSDLNEQCARGVCNEALDACEAEPILDNQPCDDGEYCTVGEVCLVGVCGFAAPRDCSALDDQCGLGICNESSQACERETTGDGEPCDDGLFCTDGETCSGGVCAGGFMHDCSNLTDQCNLGVCNEVSDACEQQASNEGAPCDDGLFCSDGELCSGGSCVGGFAHDCAHLDGDCTFGLCREDEDLCEARPRNDGRACDDGNPCNVSESCLSGACIGGGPPDCSSFDNQCNTASCHPTGAEGNCSTVTPVANGTACDDESACFVGKVCSQGVCTGGTTPDCSGADEQCLTASCDPSGVAGNCDTLSPVTVGIDCDDNDDCTYSDACDESGVCSGVDSSGIACETDQDCSIEGTWCNVTTGLCVCTDIPSLCLELQAGTLPGDACYMAGEAVLVHIVVNHGAKPITGGQFYIEYDPLTVEVIDVLPGRAVDPSSPFTFELGKAINTAEGLISYAVGVDPFGGVGTTGQAVMAAIRLRPLVTCQSIEGLCFAESVNPTRTWLVDANGANVSYVPGCCSGPLVIGGDPPALSCPPSATRNADAGELTAVVTWDPISTSGGCGGSLDLVCTGSHSNPALDQEIAQMWETGGRFPGGTSTFQCTATDACGFEAQCEWDVHVTPLTTMEVSLQLSPVITTSSHCVGGERDGELCRPDLTCPGGNCIEDTLLRCIEFELFWSCMEAPLVIEQTIAFGGRTNFPGSARNVPMKIPAEDYFCITARDPLHTLRSAASLVVVDGRYVAEFTGDPLLGGNWLVSGNVNGDRVIDSLDYGIFNSQANTAVDPDTPCGTEAPHVDINGDGVVDLLDLSFILGNQGMHDKDTCCGTSPASYPAPARGISVAELEAMGLWEMLSADLNGDGVLDQADIAVFEEARRRPPAAKKPAIRQPR